MMMGIFKSKSENKKEASRQKALKKSVAIFLSPFQPIQHV